LNYGVWDWKALLSSHSGVWDQAEIELGKLET